METSSIIENPIFNSVKELCEYLETQGHTETIFFKNPSYIKAITGITSSEQLIYDYDLMVAAAMEEGWNEEDAIEWIEYNTLRSIPYMGNLGKPPVIKISIEK